MDAFSTCDNPFSLDDLAARIRKSSNFQFAWQFYQFSRRVPQSPAEVRWALDSIIANPVLHRFLRDSFETTYAAEFTIEPLHEHSQIAASEEFESTLARAAGDHLGAYSRVLRDANAAEKREIRELFERAGKYSTYQLQPGSLPGCPICRGRNSHLFSTWFDGIAWDWCFFASWPERKLFWMGCLTDTD
jgi:hypothetical protein